MNERNWEAARNDEGLVHAGTADRVGRCAARARGEIVNGSAACW